MKNAKSMKKNIVLVALLFAVGLLSITGCRNSLQSHGDPEGAAVTGYLSLTIGSGKARTIFSAIELENLDAFSFDLDLVHLQDSANNFYIPDWDGSNIGNMAPGNWTLTVTAFLPNPGGGVPVAAARTAAPVPFTVNPGQTTSISVVYVLPLPGGDGWFSWDLVLPPDTSGWITITDLYGVQTGGGVDASVPSRISLPAGQHRTNLALSLGGTDITISRLLNVYTGMTSHWSEAFSQDDFHRSFLDFFLELWDGSSWDLSEVQSGHFGILRTDEGIEGVYAHNVADIRHWFNYIHRPPGHHGYSTANCLGTLIDAALVGIGAQDFFADEFQGERSDAEAVIRGFVRNGTGMTFEWSGDTVVATIGNRYRVEIYVRFLVPVPFYTITFDGNGYWGPTLPRPIYAFPRQEIDLPRLADRLIDGYWFVMRGWSTSSTAIGGEFEFTVGYSDATLYAVWPEYGFAFDDGTITGFSGGSTDIVIPHIINEALVTSIGNEAFADNQLTLVDIPHTIASIGEDAFASNQLTSVIIPDSVTFLGDGAFADNELTSVIISNGLTFIGSRVFRHNQLTSVVIPDNVISIGWAAFENNQLTSVVIPDSVTHIWNSAFALNLLTTVAIPGGVTYIRGFVFSNNQLTSVVIPDGVTYIGSHAFMGNQLTSVIIPDGVTYIGSRAFEWNQLTSVVIPDSVTFINVDVFGSNPLTSITIPGGVDIDSGAMGIHTSSFLAFYNSTGRRAGTYLWIEAESRWILYGHGDMGAFPLIFTGFTDAAVDINADQSVGILDFPASITVGGAFDQIRWVHNGETVPGATGAVLDFWALHGNRIGIHFVTVEVSFGGRWYSRHIRINVTR